MNTPVLETANTDIRDAILRRAKALLADGAVAAVLGWKKGDFAHDPAPAFFHTAEELDESFVYNPFCGVNLSRLLQGRQAGDGKVLAALKPCDTFSLNQMLGENRLDRDAVHVMGIPCAGKIDIEKLRRAGVRGVRSARITDDGAVVETAKSETAIPLEEALLEKCLSCKTKRHAIADELLLKQEEGGETENPRRFAEVNRLQELSPEERFAFWQNELSRCIRCNACRNACPVCACVKCVFDNPTSTVAGKANAESFEEKMFHVIRAFHVAGRCTDCGECGRACPQGIPLHLLNRKFILDINRCYGPFQAGETAEGGSPLTRFTTSDVEPCDVFGQGGENQC